jgi:hypothetical protein
LLEQLEEQFNLPTFFVNGGNGGSGELEIIGQEHQFLLFVLQPDHHPPQVFIIWPPGHKRLQANDFITANRAELEQMEDELGEDHAGALRRESGEAKTERLVGQELKRLGWTEADLAARRKSDPLKLAIAARLRKETTLSLKAIAARVHLGTSKGANTNLHKWMQAGASKKPQ